MVQVRNLNRVEGMKVYRKFESHSPLYHLLLARKSSLYPLFFDELLSLRLHCDNQLSSYVFVPIQIVYSHTYS